MEQTIMNMAVSPALLEKIEKMARDSHTSLDKIFLKSIFLMDIAINSQKKGKKLAIINANNEITDVINGI